MSAEQTYKTQRIDHLGIVAGICREIDLIGQIDGVVGESERKVSCGEAVQALVLNALGFSGRALYLMPEYLRNKPVDLLIDERLKAEDFNDDSLGRSLDDLYATGVTEVFARVAAHGLAVYKISQRFVHLDSSSFHLHGVYDPAEPEREAIEVTHGYSRAGALWARPDLKQVVVQLITSQQSALPVWLEVLSGNSSDKASFRATAQAYCGQLSANESVYLVMDSAGYSEENVQALQGTGWLMRVPETLAMAKQLVRTTERAEMTKLAPGYVGKDVPYTYGGIPQRWLVVFSEAAYERELKSLAGKQAKELTTAQKSWRKLSQQTFNCQADAEAAREQFTTRWRYHQAQAKVQEVRRYTRRGRPAAGDEPVIVGYVLRGTVVVDEASLTEAKRSLGKFIIATNELEAERLTDQEMLAHYKDQSVSVERGFRFLKDPLFFAHSLFLKKPQRLMALLMVMGLALLIYALAAPRGLPKLRQALQQQDQTLPDQRGMPTSTPTIRWIFQQFEGIDLLLVRHHGHIAFRQVLNLRPLHLQVIDLLGPEVAYCYAQGP